ncbi:MAG: 50S ribosomal protein L4 [Candidatus Anstonellales archaeon]
MKANVYDVDGKVAKEIKLPEVFSEEYREEIIRRAVLSEESKLRQPKGAYKLAGKETSARYKGEKDTFGSLKNRGQAKLPREFFGKGRWGRVRRVPHSVKGRRAHPPKVEKIIVEKMNRKEWIIALRSALAATANIKLVQKRGHRVKESPVILSDEFEKIEKTKNFHAALSKIIGEDLERSKNGKKVRSGVRRRKGGVIYPKSALFVAVSDGAIRSARNIPGIDAVKPEELKVRLLAPGAKAGRLAVYTESALKKIEEIWGRK